MRYSLTCERCHKAFAAVRKDARYCGGICRRAANHERRATEADLGASALATLAILHRAAEPPGAHDHE